MQEPSTSTGFLGPAFEPVTHQATENRQLFYAKVSKAAGEDEIKQLFAQYGTVQDVIIFQSSQGSTTSKGCGLVTMSSHAEASAAIQGLHGKYAWSSRDPPMVVTWMDAALQDPARQQHLQAAKLTGGSTRLMKCLTDERLSASEPGNADTPPAGCEPDAIKLFVGNLPLHVTEEQVLPVFKAFGTVVELVVVRNKQSSQSKGCAFVWFARRADAEAAMAQLNLKHVLPDLTGQQTRPLVVRKARTGHMHGGGGSASKPSSLGSLGEGALDSMVLPAVSLGARLQQQQQQQQHLTAAFGLSPAASNASTLTHRMGSGSLLASLQPASAQMLSHSSGALLPGSVARPVVSAPLLPANTPLHTLSYQPSFTSQASGSFPLLATHYAGLAHHHQGGMVADSIEVQPLAVHNLPPGTYVTTAGHAGVNPSMLRGVQAAGQPGQQYQLVVDMPPPAAYNLQRVVGVTGDGMEQYVQVQQVQQVPQMQQVQQLPQLQQQLQQVQQVPAAPTQLPSYEQPGPSSAPSHGTMMALDAMQMAVVNDHLYVVQARTGVQLMVSPGGPDTFHLLLTGAQPQVERAQLMLAQLINQAAAAAGM